MKDAKAITTFLKGTEYMRTILFIFLILPTTIALTGCYQIIVLDNYVEQLRNESKHKLKQQEFELKQQELRNKIDAGDLDASKHCVEDSFKSVFSYMQEEPQGKYCFRAAQNILTAYQNDPEPGLEKLYYLIAAHNTVIQILDWREYEYNNPERVKYIKAIVQLAQSQNLRNYAFDENFRQQENQKGYDADAKFRRMQFMISGAITGLYIIEHSANASDDFYRPLVCGAYQKEMDLVKTDRSLRDYPCEHAKTGWANIALPKIKERILKGSLAEAERCITECGKITPLSDNEIPIKNRKDVRYLAAEHIIKAYESMPDRQQKLLEKSRALIYLGSRGDAQDDAKTEKLLRKVAEQGDVFVQYHLGLMYIEGRGVTKNKAEGEKWLRKAAKQGHKLAQSQVNSLDVLKRHHKGAEQGDLFSLYNLGVMHETGSNTNVTKNEAEAVKWYRKAAERNYASAQLSLGMMYFHGRGVEKNDAEAVKWLRKAAEQGERYAQYNLGLMYFYGQGVEKNDADAEKWLRKAAMPGRHYGVEGALNDIETVKRYRGLAEQGDAQAQYNLGLMYSRGRYGVRNDAEAEKWYRKAAKQGHVRAQGVLDNAETLKRLRKAAERGDAQAQYNLGLMYRHGQARARDEDKPYAESVEWIRRAAEQGYAEAQYRLGSMYFENTEGVERDSAEAMKWYRRAAEQGHVETQYTLGERYSMGLGLAQDKAEAVKWYRKAAEQGHAHAQRKLGNMYYAGDGVAQDKAEAEKWHRKSTEQR